MTRADDLSDDTHPTRIRITRDMAESLLRHFDSFAAEDVVTLEWNAIGLWFVDQQTGTVRFLGQADYTESQLDRMRHLRH